MANDPKTTDAGGPQAETDGGDKALLPASGLPTAVHLLPSNVFDSRIHVGVSATFVSSGRVVNIIAPDLTSDAQKVYLTAPISITSKAILEFLEARDTVLDDKIKKRLQDAEASVELSAFYWDRTVETLELKTDDDVKSYLTDTLKMPASKADTAYADQWKSKHAVKGNATQYRYASGAFLVMFKVSFEKGIISTLVGDPSIAKLFDVTDLHVRVMRCPPDKEGQLQDYVQLLAAG